MSTNNKISWYDSFERAMAASAGDKKPVLIFFHYEHCDGCKKTISNTLPKMSVTDAINDGYNAVMVDVEQRKDLVKQYGVDWTPTFVVLGPTVGESYRWVGYLPEDDFLGHLNLALAKVSFREGDFKDAERHFDEVMIKFPLTELATEACYYIGVSRYRYTNDPSWLGRTYDNMKDAYPDSPWTLKASAWAGIKASKAA
jgi:thioredoxin-related protein